MGIEGGHCGSTPGDHPVILDTGPRLAERAGISGVMPAQKNSTPAIACLDSAGDMRQKSLFT
jgi:hypothetical protein